MRTASRARSRASLTKSSNATTASMTSRSSACARRGVPLARRIAAVLGERQRRRRADRRARHHALPRRSDAHAGRAAADRPQDRDPVLDRRAHDRPGRRRALHRAHDAGGARRADRLRAAQGDPAGGARRPRPPRAADPGRLRRQERAHVAPGERAGPPAGDRRRRRSHRRGGRSEPWKPFSRPRRRSPPPRRPARHRRSQRRGDRARSSTPPRR